MASKGRDLGNIVSPQTGIAVTFSGDPVVLGVGNTEHVRVTGAGDIYLGGYLQSSTIHNTLQKIAVAPYNWTGGSTAEIASIEMGAESTGSDDGNIIFKTATNVNSGGTLNEAMRIRYDGNVGIGVTNYNVPVELTVVGNVRAGYDPNIGVTLGLSPVGIPTNDVNSYILWGDNASFGGNNGDLIYVPRTSVSASHRFYAGSTTPSEKVRIDSDGLKFNGDSADANALDDYEEGTWSPQVTQGVSGTATYANQYGWYTKIGRLVTLYFYLRFASTGNTGDNTRFRVGNFPFPIISTGSNTTYHRGMGVTNYHSIPGFTSANIAFYGAGTSNTFADVYQGSTVVATSSAVNSQYIIGGFEYFT